MTEVELQNPATGQLVLALEALIDPKFVEPIHLDSADLERVRALLTLWCVGGPEMPEMPERELRFQEVRKRLRTCAAGFLRLDRQAFPRKFKPADPSDEAYAEESRRLADATVKLFQLGPSRDPGRDMTSLWRELSDIWSKNATWFKRYRLDYVLAALAEWFVETEMAYRVERSMNSAEPQPRDVDEEEITADEGDEPADTDVGPVEQLDDEDDLVIKADEPEGFPSVSRNGRPKRHLSLRLVAGVFAAVLVVGALALVLIAQRHHADSEQTVAGQVARVLGRVPVEDLAVAGGYVWAVNSLTETATRVSEADGERRRFFLELPPYVGHPAPGTGIRIGGYRVAAGRKYAWVVTNGGSVLALDTESDRVKLLDQRIKVGSGEPALYRGSLWIGGLGSYPVFRLRPRDGAVERKFVPQTSNPFPGIETLAAGAGSIWALDYVHERRVYKLTPVPGRLGVEEALLPLDRPAEELAAGLGALWTVNEDRTVTRYDPATGNPSKPIRVPGGARRIALSQDAVWVATGNSALVRIDPITLSGVGQPIELPGYPLAIGADRNVWVATERKLVEIEPAT